jgi:hypothetical protein
MTKKYKFFIFPLMAMGLALMLLSTVLLAKSAAVLVAYDVSSSNFCTIARIESHNLIAGNYSKLDEDYITTAECIERGVYPSFQKSKPKTALIRNVDNKIDILQYCAAGSTATDFEYISKVKMGSIDNSSGRGAGGYQDFTGLSTDVQKGAQATVIITVDGAYGSDQILIWADWDQNSDFFGANELVYQSSGTGFTSPHTASFTVPEAALTGATRIRIRLHDSDIGPNNTPCGNSDYGEVEDYTVNVVSSGVQYCTAGSTATSFEYISHVAMGSIANSSGRGAGGYQDFTGLSTDVQKGAQVTVIITVDEAYGSDQILIWADWDQNSDFFGANELVYQSSGTGFTSPYTGSFTVPEGALSGTTRLRIRLHDSDIGPNNTPCGNSDYGEVEDYTVNVVSSSGQLPTLTTASTTNITQTSATSGGNVTSDGGAAVTARGVVWSTNQNPTIQNNQGITSDGAGTGTFTSNLTGLSPATQYYVRAYATNSNGTAYGNQQSFSTDSPTGVPVVSTAAVTNVTETSATSGGNVTSDGGASVTARGVVWSTSQNPTIENNQGITSNGSGNGAFTSNLNGLSPATQYYVRAYATNSNGTAYGNQQSFSTSSSGEGTPLVYTTEPSAVKTNSAVAGGFVSSPDGAAVTARGMVWSTNLNPTLSSNQGSTNNGSGTGAFTSNLTNLKKATTYYARAYASSSGGTAYGNQVSFTTRQEQTGTIQLTLALPDPCTSLGISELFSKPSASFNFIIYPNPTQGDFILEISSKQKIGNISIQVINIYGQVIINENSYSDEDKHVNQFNAAQLPKGVYLVRIIRNTEMLSKKLIVK